MAQTFKTRFGIDIKICCASCQFREFDKEGDRICALTQQFVKARGLCEEWHLSEGLEKAGAGGGTVKSYEHLMQKLSTINIKD